jgi:hypothetical protein
MANIRIYDQLKKLNLINWATLFVGFEKGLITKNDIADYAVYLLSNKSNFEQKVALLADANNYDEYEIKNMILSQIDPKNIVKETEIEKLKLSALISLDELKLSEEKKCDKLQELYIVFDYPEDMSECSIYSNNKNSPLGAMRNLIMSLKKKYKVN